MGQRQSTSSWYFVVTLSGISWIIRSSCPSNRRQMRRAVACPVGPTGCESGRSRRTGPSDPSLAPTTPSVPTPGRSSRRRMGILYLTPGGSVEGSLLTYL
jgi:hypothetical protein